MSNKSNLAQNVEGLSVHTFSKSDQQLVPSSSSSAAAAAAISSTSIPPLSSETNTKSCDSIDAQNTNPQPLQTFSNVQRLDDKPAHFGNMNNATQLSDKTVQLSDKTAQLSQKTVQPGFSNHIALQPNADDAELISNLDQWVQDLNQMLQKHHPDTASLIPLLTTARQLCDDQVKSLTDEYRAHSENVLKSMLKKPSTKKQQKKTLRMFDTDLRTVNHQVDELMVVRRQLDSRLKQLVSQKRIRAVEEGLPGQQPQPMPILTPAESRAKGGGGGKSCFCRDLMLCVLLSCMVMLLLAEVFSPFWSRKLSVFFLFFLFFLFFFLFFFDCLPKPYCVK